MDTRVQIKGTDTTLAFPDSMSEDEIKKVLSSHPYVKQLQQDAEFNKQGIPSKNQPGDPFANFLNQPLARGIMGNFAKVQAANGPVADSPPANLGFQTYQNFLNPAPAPIQGPPSPTVALPDISTLVNPKQQARLYTPPERQPVSRGSEIQEVPEQMQVGQHTYTQSRTGTSRSQPTSILESGGLPAALVAPLSRAQKADFYQTPLGLGEKFARRVTSQENTLQGALNRAIWGFSTPESLSLLALGGGAAATSKLAGRLVSLGFSEEMARSAVNEAQHGRGWDAAVAGLMAAAGGYHGLPERAQYVVRREVARSVNAIKSASDVLSEAGVPVDRTQLPTDFRKPLLRVGAGIPPVVAATQQEQPKQEAVVQAPVPEVAPEAPSTPAPVAPAPTGEGGASPVGDEAPPTGRQRGPDGRYVAKPVEVAPAETPPVAEAPKPETVKLEELPDYAQKAIKLAEGYGFPKDRAKPPEDVALGKGFYDNSEWEKKTVPTSSIKSPIKGPVTVHPESTKGPLILDADGTLIDGAHRLANLKSEGVKTVEVYQRVESTPPEPTPATPVKAPETAPSTETPVPEYGSTNKIVTQDRYEELKKRISQQKLSAGVDPEMLKDLVEMGIYHIEAGTRSLAQWMKRMQSDTGADDDTLKKVWAQTKKDERLKAPVEPVKAPETVEAKVPEKAPQKPAETPPPPKEPGKPTGKAKPPGDVTGPAKVITGRPAKEGVTIPQQVEAGQKFIDTKGEAYLLDKADEVIKSGKPTDDEHIAAMAVHLRTLRNRRNAVLTAIDKTHDMATLADLNRQYDIHDAQTEKLLEASDITANQNFHRLGMALQIALDKNYRLVDLPRRAKAASMGMDDVDPGVEAKVKGFQTKDAKEQAAMDDAVNGIHEDLKSGPPPPKTSWESSFWKRQIDNVQQMFGLKKGIPPVEPPGGPRKGAVSYTIPTAEIRQMQSLRRIARKIAFENPDFTFDQLMTELRDKTGLTDKAQFPDERLYYALSEPYRKHMIESDVNRIKADRYLRNLKKTAEYKLQPAARKAWAWAGDIYNMTQRTMQAGADISFQFMQGRKGIFADFMGWLRSWATGSKAVFKGSEFADRHLANIENSPQWPAAKAAGLQMRRMGDRFSPEQDELFAGSLIHVMSNLNVQRFKSPAMNKVGNILLSPFKLIGKIYDHTEAAFVAAANDLTWSTYQKMAAADPKNPAYLRDTASTINTIYGRGASRFAREIGAHQAVGKAIYAPRYLVSSFEYLSGRPIRKAETGLGRAQAMKVYAAQAAVYGSLVALAKMNGWNVDTDPRSSDFGKLEAPMPNGKKYKLDMFAKEAQAFRLINQLVYGKISQSGTYTPPSTTEAAKNAGLYAVSKLAPGPGMAVQAVFGKLQKTHSDNFVTKPITGKDVMLRYTPLWIQQGLEDGLFDDIPSLSLNALSIAGEGVEKGKIAKTKIPFKPLKPGILQKSK